MRYNQLIYGTDCMLYDKKQYSYHNWQSEKIEIKKNQIYKWDAQGRIKYVYFRKKHFDYHLSLDHTNNKVISNIDEF